MQRYAIYYLGIIFIFFSSCSKQSEEQSAGRLFQGFKEVKKITFPLDSMTAQQPLGYDYFENEGKQYYVHGSKSKFCLQFYNLQTQEKEFEIKLKKEGENAIEGFSLFKVKSLDSIFIAYPYTHTVWHINQLGEVKKKYRWANTKPEGIISPATAMENMVIQNDTLHFISMPEMGGAKDLHLNNTNLWLDLKTGNVGFNYKFPEIYNKGNFFYASRTNSRCIGHDGLVVYSFAACEELYTTRYNSNKLVPTKKVKSTLFDKIEQGNSQYDEALVQKETIENAFYLKIMYDPFRHLYYRLVKLPFKPDEGTNASESSMIIADEEFNVLGEETFTKDMSFGFPLFITKDGLFTLSPAESEDELIIRCFEPVLKSH